LKILQFKKLLFFILFLAPLIAISQVQIKGQVIDSKDNSALPGVNVLLISQSDSTKLLGTSTDINGDFSLDNIERGNYLMRISFIGYEKEEKMIYAYQPIVQAGTFKLKPSAVQLKTMNVEEVQVRVEQKGDTTQFNADAYKTNPDASAEDLVTKMPGVTIENGTIKAQGENVKQVFVDGKQFFGNDPNAALKNIPAEVISQVQVYDRMSDQARFTGVDDGNSNKAINIITKPGKNNGQFGKAYAGYGTDDRYNAGTTMNFFNGDRRITLLAHTNNINQQNFSDEDLMGLGGGGGQWRGAAGGGWRRMSPEMENLMVNQQAGIAATNAIGLNYSDSWGKKLNVSGSYFFNNSNNDLRSDLTRSFFASGGTNDLIYNENNNALNSNYNHRVNFRLEYNIDSVNSLILTPRISLQNNRGRSFMDGAFLYDNDFTESLTSNDVNTSGMGYNISNGILFRHKMKKDRRSFSVNLDKEFKENDIRRNQYSSNIIALLNDTSIIDQQTFQFSTARTISSNVVYTEPLGGKSVVQFNYTPSYSESVSARENKLVDPNGEYTILDSLLSNKFDNLYFTQRVGSIYRLNDAKTNFSIGANYQNAVLSGNQTFPDDLNVSRTFNNILPEAMYNYKFSETTNMRLRYRTYTGAPNVNQLQNVINNSNPLMLSTGNPDLNQSYTHSLFTRYGITNVKKGKSFFIFFFGNYTQDFITNETIIPRSDTTLADGITLSRGMQLVRPVNMDGHWNNRVFLSYGLPISKLKSNLNFNSGVSLLRSPGLINGQVNFANNYGINNGLTLGSNVSEKLDFTIGYNANYSIVKNSLLKQSDNNFFIQTSSFKVNWLFGKGFLINSNLSHTMIQGLSANFNQNFLLWNASLGYKFLKDKSLEVKATVFDILRQNRSINRSVTEVFVEDIQTNVLSRYLMFTVTYNVRKYKPVQKRVE
jgi:hypothetical protein